MGDQQQYIAYGGRVSWTDFLLFPLPVFCAIAPLFFSDLRWPAITVLVLSAWWLLALAAISTSALNARQWVGGARIQLPLILSCLFLGETAWFSSLYWLISRANGDAFSQPLDRVAAFYFSLTTITTTGFGDIYAKSQGARLAVSAEMVCSVLTIVVLIATSTAKAFEEFDRPKVRVLDDKESSQGEKSSK